MQYLRIKSKVTKGNSRICTNMYCVFPPCMPPYPPTSSHGNPSRHFCQIRPTNQPRDMTANRSPRNTTMHLFSPIGINLWPGRPHSFVWNFGLSTQYNLHNYKYLTHPPQFQPVPVGENNWVPLWIGVLGFDAMTYLTISAPLSQADQKKKFQTYWNSSQSSSSSDVRRPKPSLPAFGKCVDEATGRSVARVPPRYGIAESYY